VELKGSKAALRTYGGLRHPWSVGRGYEQLSERESLEMKSVLSLPVVATSFEEVVRFRNNGTTLGTTSPGLYRIGRVPRGRCFRTRHIRRIHWRKAILSLTLDGQVSNFMVQDILMAAPELRRHCG
jgi:hypothetical protein